jgi:hypothetical protein
MTLYDLTAHQRDAYQEPPNATPGVLVFWSSRLMAHA